MSETLTQRRPYVAGNWKMNLEREGAHELALAVGMLAERWTSIDIGVFPGFLVLGEVSRGTIGGALIVGAQNCHFENKGAATGEVSPTQIKECGATSVIIGHSERRSFAKEDLSQLEKKVNAALKEDLQVIYCVGESEKEREAGEAELVVKSNLAFLKDLPKEVRSGLDVAYEPIWAIGSGSAASPEDAEAMHQVIRGELDRFGGFGGSRVLYGGSVKGENAEALIIQGHIDGFLVGGAALKIDSFLEIVKAVADSLPVSEES